MYFVPRIGKFWYSSQRGYEAQEENLMPREGGLKQFLDWATMILSNNICNENMLYTINYYLRIIQASLDSAFGLFYQAYTLFFWLLSLPQMLPNSRGSFICTSPGLEIPWLFDPVACICLVQIPNATTANTHQTLFSLQWTKFMWTLPLSGLRQINSQSSPHLNRQTTLVGKYVQGSRLKNNNSLESKWADSKTSLQPWTVLFS